MTKVRRTGPARPSGFIYDPAAAQRAVEFFTRYLTHVKGERAGTPLELQEWAVKHVIQPLFGWKRPDGSRRYRTVYVAVPRKNAKSTIAAGIALYLLLADGEPGAEVYSAAADKHQAAIVFDLAKSMLEANPSLAARGRPLRHSITVPKTNSIYRVLSADVATKHGLNGHGIIFDELHAQPNRDLYDVLTTSVGSRRQPVIFMLTTAGFDQTSICYEVHHYAEQVRDGIIQDDTFLPVIYGAPMDADWTSERVWEAANPGLGVTIKREYLRSECKKALEIPAAQNTFRRLHLNQWTQQNLRWIPMELWNDQPAPTVPLTDEGLKRMKCYGGLDLSSTLDISALVWLFDLPGPMVGVLPRFFVPEEGLLERERRDMVPYTAWVRDGWITTTRGNVIDYDFIRARVNKDRQLFRVKELAYDPYGAVQLASQLEGDGARMVKCRQGFLSISPPSKELLTLLMQRRIAHGGNPVLKWMASNVAVTEDAAGNVKPDKAKSTKRIDGIVALIMAQSRRGLVTKKTSVYARRGMLTLTPPQAPSEASSLTEA